MTKCNCYVTDGGDAIEKLADALYPGPNFGCLK